MDQRLREAALEYHRLPTPGKISVTPTKGLSNQRDLALAYSPGVAAACEAIVADPREADTLTSRSNLVAVVTNGTAVLGLGNIGALAGKPVMEGKGCLFKKFSGIDVFDIELDRARPRQDRGHRRRARAHVRRHQPRGHQGARVLLHRAEAPGAHEDPGLPRRPARHGDHRRRGLPERAQGGGQGHQARQARRLGRRRRGAGLPRPAGEPRAADGEHHRRGHPRRRLPGSHRGHGPEQGALRARTRRREPWARSSPAPTSSSDFRPAAC